jgi:hypothetical protein
MTDAISMAEFNAAKAKATNLQQSERDDQIVDAAVDAAWDIAQSITGRCEDCGERVNDALTVQIVIGNLAESLRDDAGFTRDDLVSYLDSVVFNQERDDG